MKTIALIPARVGSKGVPGKNFREFCDKPLWRWALDTAFVSGVFEKIIVSSDGGLIDVPEDNRIIVDNTRPAEFATDEAPLDPLLVYYMKKYPEFELWCLLQPTSPLRTAGDIRGAYKKVCKDKYDSLVTVTPCPCMCWVENAVGLKGKTFPIATYHIHKRPNHQDRKEWFREVGIVYFTKKYVLEQTECRLGGNIALYKIPRERSFGINDEIDWAICEMLIKRKRKS